VAQGRVAERLGGLGEREYQGSSMKKPVVWGVGGGGGGGVFGVGLGWGFGCLGGVSPPKHRYKNPFKESASVLPSFPDE